MGTNTGNTTISGGTYVAGVFDAYMGSSVIAAHNLSRVEGLHACVKAMNLNLGQLVAIVDKYLNDHPERWGNPMAALTFTALAEACQKQGRPF